MRSAFERTFMGNNAVSYVSGKVDMMEEHERFIFI
jgi:hypothetical protein